MWRLISIVVQHLRNAWTWSRRNPFPIVVVLHAVFLTLFCLRHVPSITFQLQRKRSALTLVGGPHPFDTPVFAQRATPGTQGERDVLLKEKIAKETIASNNKRKIKKAKQPAPSYVKTTEDKRPACAPELQRRSKCFSKRSEKNVSNGCGLKNTKKVKEPAPKKEPKKKEKPVPEKKSEKKEIEQKAKEPEKIVHTGEFAGEINVSQQAGLACTTEACPSSGEILHTRILEAWKPPRNVRPQSPCVVRIIVGKGTLETKPEVISSSGSNAFDMSARRALLEVKFPQELWNRAITIHFV